MRKFLRLGTEWLSLLALLLLSPGIASAVQAPALATPSGLSIAEIKITGDEFLLLQNNSATAIPDLSSYWLYDFNATNPLAAGVTSSQQQLPAVKLDAGQTLLLSAVTRPTCGAEIAGKLSVSFTDGGGFLEIVQLAQNSGGAVTQLPGDVVSWSSTTAGLIPSVPTSTKDPAGMYYRYQKDATPTFGWQLADVDGTNSCQLNVITGSTSQPASTSGLNQPTSQPPATIVSLTGSATTAATVAATMPPADLGLTAPQITELLPNPIGTDNDDTDEFIELYNSNTVAFDLSGFVLQTGLTTKHNYTFPSGTMLPPQTFVAFYSSDTGLSLSNTSGQAAVIDPLGNVISQSDTYGTAKDGQTWSLAKGTWYWTLQATPSAANVIQQPAATTKKASSSKSKTVSAKAATTKKSSSSSNAAPTGGNSVDTAATVTPIHPWTLAVVAGLALLYGLYEYRLDIQNRFYQFRKHRASRRVTRYALPGR